MAAQRFESVDYGERGKTPHGYSCGKCGVSGVRLYRRYQTVLDYQDLFCTACALVDQHRDRPDNEYGHSIGWLVAAVPTEDGYTYWGYTSVPQPGVEWWDALPVKAGA